ncbi:hypothetical protein DPMN_029954 [Dreissena polymorpha]|uniref:Uncharacterized protein n=1 Tax=Dreissena polymorpha TaxID=45954 RepID=A0A9D4M1R8_DREPO|nr:hypothetical protein DPMN_029954 [Dreissena polymorpha]
MASWVSPTVSVESTSVDEVEQCKDVPPIKAEVIPVSSDSETEEKTPGKGAPTLVGVSNTGVIRVPRLGA